jgi:glycosyltransferase involved in cell wall biosynthesis
MSIRARTQRQTARATRRQHSLSIVIPVFNESGHIAATIGEAAAAAEGSGFGAEFVVVDDGSTDGSGDIAQALRLEVPVNVVRQPNQGRIAARRAGLAAATGEYTLFLDSRVKLEPGGLSFVHERLRHGENVWNSHVVIDTAGNPYGKFWDVLTRLFWSDYFDRPRTTSFGADDFDRYPKGTTGFLAPTELLRKGFSRLNTYYADERYTNDDTSIIRWIASQQPIHISPEFACTYLPRTTLQGFARHSFHRGIVFLDGHGRRESRFFPAVVAFYPLSVAVIPLAVRSPKLAAAFLVGGVASLAAALRLRGFRTNEAASFAALAPLYAVAHGAGMWKGLAMMLGRRWRQTAR